MLWIALNNKYETVRGPTPPGFVLKKISLLKNNSAFMSFPTSITTVPSVIASAVSTSEAFVPVTTISAFCVCSKGFGVCSSMTVIVAPWFKRNAVRGFPTSNPVPTMHIGIPVRSGSSIDVFKYGIVLLSYFLLNTICSIIAKTTGLINV